MAGKSTKSVGKKPKSEEKFEESVVTIPKEKVVMFFMAFGIISVFAAFYQFLAEYIYMPKTLAFFVLALLFFFLALMYNVSGKK
ncbi:MAG TPA: hypothetical protein PLX15_05210 [Candidatus Woesearchaeota archaeon]|nr:hypothetical protein [Candidatus Woesearchaeota archaeon]